ncbi:MAG: hypothetical protein KDK61_08365 [Simkania sp.]|nr:hypothetical protein [Nanoarchaeota archaeon]MCB1084312.1 hypothetical protein [Simkania sp.]
MAILNFGFTKILVEKKGKLSKQINIKSGMNITDVAESEMIDATKQKAFLIKFAFETNYEPKLGNINLEGELLYLLDAETAKTVSDSWKKNKSLPKDIALKVFNKILHNCNVEALILSREINLPSPIQLPKVKSAPVQEKAPAKK